MHCWPRRADNTRNRDWIRTLPMLQRMLDRLVDVLAAKLEPRLLNSIGPKVMERLADKPWTRNLFVPSVDVYRVGANEPFMAYSTCSSRDFFHPEFKRIFDSFHFSPFFFHRKYWEWVFIAHHIAKLQLEGKCGLGFGVGATEPLSAAFAASGATIVATDAPAEIGVGSGWAVGGAFADGVKELRHEGIIDLEHLAKRASFRVCDMNAIPDDLNGFDFCWSSCCLEHLGTLRKGIDFIINSVEKTLKVGGTACHTTEFNLSSNEATVAEGSTVLYRRRDIDQLVGELVARGHNVDEFRIAPDSLAIDGYVDTPPFGPPVHLKLDLLSYTCTSAGLVIRRGR